MAEADFTVVYRGPALAEGRMPVRELAPALLALGDLFAEASTAVYPDREPVSLNIKATEAGSFLVHLTLEAKRTWDEVVDIFGSDSASALANLEAIVIGGGTVSGGLFWLIRRMAGRKIVSQDASPLRPGYVRLTLDDNTTLETPTEAVTLYESEDVRRKTRIVVAPLRREGIDELEFDRKDDEPLVVEKDDVAAFEVPEEPDETLLEQEHEMIVEIVGVAFTEGNKWRLSDGQNTFYATVEDYEFLERVDKGIESFRKGDMLRCQVRVVQSRRLTGGLQSEYHVVQVIEHIVGHTQMRFEDDADDDTG